MFQLFSSSASFFHTLITFIAGAIGLNFLVGFHELGHFLFCKLFNIHTPSFSIGFGPALFSKKIGSTVFSLSAIPLGGYVEIAGFAEIGQGEQLHAHANDAHSFNQKPYYQKLLVLLGGIIFNLAFAYAAFIFIFMAGLPKTQLISSNTPLPIIATVNHASAAEKAGLKAGDIIVKAQETVIKQSIEPIRLAIEASEGAPVHLTVKRQGEDMEFSIAPDKISVQGKIGWSMGITYDVSTPTIHTYSEAFYQGIAETNRWIKQIASGLCACKRLGAIKEMAGPLMILSILATKAATDGYKIFLIILAIISINLALLNLIPLPILDGGQLLFCTIEAIIRRPVPERIRTTIHMITWALFIILFIVLTFQDINRIAGHHISRLISLIKS